ncbi:hypothetical protein [Haliangium sp.]|uniref:hypothetical protein n=1 Tax=Haliangium sp. TaxID=2663208 RepID=UPI003D111F79
MQDKAGIVVLLAAALTVLGCSAAAPAPTPSPGARAGAPSADELARIAATPAPERVLDMHALLVPEWNPTGPFPALGLDPLPPDAGEADPWTAALTQRLATLPEAMASIQLRCAAREVSGFVRAHGVRPAPGLVSYLASRCGSAAVRITAGVFRFADDGRDQAALYAEYADRVAALFTPLTDGDPASGAPAEHRPREAGIWFDRAPEPGGQAVVVVITGERWVALDQAARSPDPAGQVVIRGRFLHPAASARAAVSTGRYGARACRFDPSARAPAFGFICQPDPGDAGAWIEVATFTPDRALGQRALDLLLWPRGQPPAVYRRPTYVPTQPARTTPDLDQAFLDAVNQVRARAELPPLQAADEQRRSVTALAPHYFDALYDEDRQDLLDRIALGLIAGWHVPGTVHHGQLGAMMVPSSDLADLVAAALEGPFGRSVLLDPDAHYLAASVLYEPATQTLAALFGAYAVAERVDREAVAERARAALERAHRARGPRPPVRRLGGVGSVLADAVAAIDAGRLSPEAAMGQAMFDAGVRVGRRVRGWSIEVSSPDEIEFPAELLDSSDVAVAMAATTYARPGEPGLYVVLILASP